MLDLSIDSNQLIISVVVALAAAVAVFLIVYPYFSGEMNTDKRIAGVAETKINRTVRRTKDEEVNSRRKQVSDSIRDIEENQKKKEKVSLRVSLQRAGLEITPRTFWIFGVGFGLLLGLGIFIGVPGAPIAVPLAAAFVGIVGIPKWVLKKLITRRQTKFTSEFANCIDIIVRGVKSGLPLNECLNIIARESPSPVREEFQDMVEQQRVGVPIADCFDRMMLRVPTPEVKFFAIVIGIQQQAGGNLSEALGNLSGVLRDRKTLQNKVKSLSAEAKASAWVLGSLPFVVTLLVYLSNPAYIMVLFTTKLGHFMLMAAGFWMTCGVLIMRKMINFKY